MTENREVNWKQLTWKNKTLVLQGSWTDSTLTWLLVSVMPRNRLLHPNAKRSALHAFYFKHKDSLGQKKKRKKKKKKLSKRQDPFDCGIVFKGKWNVITWHFWSWTFNSWDSVQAGVLNTRAGHRPVHSPYASLGQLASLPLSRGSLCLPVNTSSLVVHESLKINTTESLTGPLVWKMNPSNSYNLKKESLIEHSFERGDSMLPCDIPREEKQNICNQKPVSSQLLSCFNLVFFSPPFLLHCWIHAAGAEALPFLQTHGQWPPAEESGNTKPAGCWEHVCSSPQPPECLRIT